MIHRPQNTYTPGQALDPVLHAIGRPVTLYAGANQVIAGTIVRVHNTADGLRYDIQAALGGAFRDIRLGDLNNPQPNTFTYAP